MASNSKSRARSEANKAKRDTVFEKVLEDIRKVLASPEARIRHYIPSGQPYTTLKNEVGAAKIKKT